MSFLEVLVILAFYTFVFSVLVYSYLRSKISNFRIEKINDYMDIRERDFEEKFQKSLQEFRESGINLQHDLTRFDRLREGVQNTFQTLESRTGEVDRLAQDMEKTSNFYRELQNSFKENSLKFQEFTSKLKVAESDFENNEEAVRRLSKTIAELEENFSKEVLKLEANFKDRLEEVEKNLVVGYEQVVNLNKVNIDKFKQQYTDLEADFKDSVDVLVAEEKKHLQSEVQEIRSVSEAEIHSLQANLTQQENRIQALVDRYSDWEKEVAEHRQMTQDRIDRFSESVLSAFKEKIDDYQEEIFGLLDQKYQQLNRQSEVLEDRNKLKGEALESLQAFVDDSRKTIVYQINNLSEFLEEQKEIQNSLYQKNRLVLVESYKNLRADLEQMQDEINTVNQNRKAILDEIHDYLDERLYQAMTEETPRVLKEVFALGDRGGKSGQGVSSVERRSHFESTDDRQQMISALEYYFNDRVKESIKANVDLVIEKLKDDPAWIKFLEEQAQLKLVDKLDTDLLRKKYVSMEVDFRGMVDRLVKDEEARFEAEVTKLSAGPEEKITRLQADLREYDGQIAKLLTKYGDWEKRILEKQHQVKEEVDQLSQRLLSGIEKRMQDYRQEMIGHLENEFNRIENQAAEIESRNDLKEKNLNTLEKFLEKSKATIGSQVSAFTNFIEEERKNQSQTIDNDYQNLHASFEEMKDGLTKLHTEIEHAQNKKQLIQEDFHDYVEGRLYQVVNQEAPRLFREIFDEDLEGKKGKMAPEHRAFLQEMNRYFVDKVKISMNVGSAWLIEKLKQDQSWQTFLEEQARVNVIGKLKTEKIFNELKKNFSKEFLRRELNEDVKSYKREVEGIGKSWEKLSREMIEKKKFLDRILVQGEDKLENLFEGIKLNLSDKEQSLQDFFNETIIGVEKKMASVTERIDFFLNKTKSMEKIFIFQKEFTATMDDYQKQLADLKKTEKRFAVFRENFQKLEKDNQRLQSLQDSLKEKESEVSNLAKQLQSVVGMTSEVQGRIETIKKQSTEIDAFLLQLEGYEQDIVHIKQDLNSLKEAQGEFKEVRDWVEEIRVQSKDNQEKVDLFLGQVAAGEELQKKVSDNIKSLEKQSFSLDERYKAIEYFNKKFDQFDLAVYDVEKRIETIRSLKKEMVVQQDNLGSLRDGFNEQISTILKIFQNQRENDSQLFTELDKKFESLPQTLSDIGWSDKEIAKHLHLELFEVQTLLKRRKGKK